MLNSLKSSIVWLRGPGSGKLPKANYGLLITFEES